MRIKRFVSGVLALALLITNGCYAKSNSSDMNFDQEEVIFVSDEKITLDSMLLSKCLSKMEKKELRFVKPDENSDNVLSKELFPEGSPKPSDVQQNGLELCYFFAVLSTVAEKDPGLIKRNLVDDGEGNVIVKLFNPHSGKPMYIKVQKTVPQLLSRYNFLGNDCLWVHMYMKAFVASGFSGVSGYLVQNSKRSYKKAEIGCTDLSIRIITGNDTKTKRQWQIKLSSQEKLYNEFESVLSRGGYICCDFTPRLNVLKDRSIPYFGKQIDHGLVRYHAYSVEKVYKDENGQKWVTIRNPWNFTVATYNKDGKMVEDQANDNNGYSTIKWEDFCKKCGNLDYSIDKPIRKRCFIERLCNYLDPVQRAVRFIESTAIKFGIKRLKCGIRKCKDIILDNTIFNTSEKHQLDKSKRSDRASESESEPKPVMPEEELSDESNSSDRKSA